MNLKKNKLTQEVTNLENENSTENQKVKITSKNSVKTLN